MGQSHQENRIYKSTLCRKPSFLQYSINDKKISPTVLGKLHWFSSTMWAIAGEINGEKQARKITKPTTVNKPNLYLNREKEGNRTVLDSSIKIKIEVYNTLYPN